MNYSKYIKPNTDGTFMVYCMTQGGMEDVGAVSTYAEAVKTWDEANFAFNHVPIPNRGTSDNIDRDDEYGMMGGTGISDSEMDWLYGRMEAWEQDASDIWLAKKNPTDGSVNWSAKTRAMGAARAYVSQMIGIIQQYRKKYPNDHI